MLKKLISQLSIVFVLFSFSCANNVASSKNKSQAKAEIVEVLTNWHKAASNADFDSYFNKMTPDAVFIGTDPTENWTYNTFKVYAKPYFERGKAWSFKALDRAVFVSESKNIAWFNELLDTDMGLCRGTGVMKLTASGWKIKHYVLSVTVPNKNLAKVISDKQLFDNRLKNSIMQSETVK